MNINIHKVKVFGILISLFILFETIGIPTLTTLPFSTLRFDGVDDYIEVSSPSLTFRKGDIITIEIWVKVSNMSDYFHTFLTKGRTYSSEHVNYALRYFKSPNSPIFYIEFYYQGISGSWNTWRSDCNPFHLEEFHQIVFIHSFGSPNNTRLYIDGKKIAGAWIQGNGQENPVLTQEPLWIGRINSSTGLPAGEPFNGELSIIRIYKSELAENEITYNLFNPTSPITKELLLYFCFVDSEKNICQDYSTNNITGKIHGPDQDRRIIRPYPFKQNYIVIDIDHEANLYLIIDTNYIIYLYLAVILLRYNFFIYFLEVEKRKLFFNIRIKDLLIKILESSSFLFVFSIFLQQYVRDFSYVFKNMILIRLILVILTSKLLLYILTKVHFDLSESAV